MFEINDVVVRFGETKELGPLNLRVAEGEKVVIFGKSGSGKTTLFRLLLGFLQPESGEVKFCGEVVESAVAWGLRKSWLMSIRLLIQIRDPSVKRFSGLRQNSESSASSCWRLLRISICQRPTLIRQ